MKTQIINRISKKVQMAAAGIAVASSLAVLAPMTASAQYGSLCRDYTGDAKVNAADVAFVVSHYRSETAPSFTMADVVQTVVQASNHEVCSQS